MNKKLLLSMLCVIGLSLFLACWREEINSDIEIKIVNNSSMDLHITFYPNKFTNDEVDATYKFSDVTVNKGETVSLIVEFRYIYTYRPFVGNPSVYYGPYLGGIQKIIFSKPETGEQIKEVDKIPGLFKPLKNYDYILEITDELLNLQGE